MNDEQRILEKIKRIEALFAGATTPGERAAAASAVGYKGTALYQELAAALRDPNPRVVAEAHAVLVKLLGEDLGPRPEASGLDCFEASRRWEQWIEENESAGGPRK